MQYNTTHNTTQAAADMGTLGLASMPRAFHRQADQCGVQHHPRL